MSDSDRNFWVRTIFSVIILAMMSVAIWKFGVNFGAMEWTGVGIVFVIIALAVILPPSLYMEFLKDLPATLGAIMGKMNIFRKSDPVEPADKPKDGDCKDGDDSAK